jgi:hypothetical protein
MGLWVNGSVLDCGTRWVFTNIIIAFPVLQRSDGSRHKPTPAVRTDIVQDGVNTGGTERALIGTDTCIQGIGWQHFVTVLTGWSKFKHHVLLLLRLPLDDEGDAI